MRYADLQEGRLYVVSHARAQYPQIPARLIRRSESGGYHTFAVPEDTEADVLRYTVEFGVKSRDVEREWTADDDVKKVERQRERERIAQLQSHLDAWFEGFEGLEGLSGSSLRSPAEIKDRERLFFFGEATVQKVLHALEATYGQPWIKALPAGAPALTEGGG